MNEEEIFHQALSRSHPEERKAYLEQACAGNAALRASVEALLRANIGASGFMDSPAPAHGATLDKPHDTERSGTVIGPYKLLEQIGEGGFGVVFMAEQQEPIGRKVALKVLKPGMDTRQVIARFEAERQALALMDHPSIAKVYEAGETSCGRPYFVMELVKGIPITDFCDQNQLPPRDRLELFVHVCQAVQHAHQKGIIHRDIKPTNVLVTLQDDAPLVKVIDFGIAKAMGQQLTDKTLFTNFAQLIGTPLYMSPEQAALSNVDVDTRGDIYSLGVLLYELLTGTTPFDKERLKEAGYDEIRRIIREEEPAKPSTRISTLGQAATTVSTQRKSDPRRLSQLLRGELDWIVMKALEKDRDRRYETAGAFAVDVQRYLHDLPVQACPPSALYRCRKFARRNKVVLAITTCMLAALALGSGLATWQWRIAEARHVQAVQAAEKRAKAEAVAKAINQFLIKDLIGAASPEEARGRKITVEEVLDKGAANIDSAFPDQPEVEAAVRMAIGQTYRSLALYPEAEQHVKRALALRQEFLGLEHPDTLETLKVIGQIWIYQGRYAEAEQLDRQTLETVRRVLSVEHRLALDLEHDIALAVREQGRWKEAEVLFQHCLQMRKRVLGEEDQDTLETMTSLAFLLGERMGKWRDAEPLARRCLEVREAVLGKNNPSTVQAADNLHGVLLTEGKWKDCSNGGCGAKDGGPPLYARNWNSWKRATCYPRPPTSW